MTLVLAASAYTARGCAARCWGPAEGRRRGPFHLPPDGRLGEAIRTKQTVQVADVAATQAYAAIRRSSMPSNLVAFGPTSGKDNELIGIIAIYRQEVRPFTDKQVAVLTSFANQAVIATAGT
jgi:putative methionine-R-sulfoxide reductase with GAF domain